MSVKGSGRLITKEWILDRVKINPISGCWEWQKSLSSRGYAETREHGKSIVIHRRAFELWTGTFLGKLLACHKCDNKLCCNPDHIFSGTSSDNVVDSIVKRRYPVGARNNNSKLTWEQADQIRKIDLSLRKIAAIFGVDQSCIWRIKHNRSYNTAYK